MEQMVKTMGGSNGLLKTMASGKQSKGGMHPSQQAKMQSQMSKMLPPGMMEQMGGMSGMQKMMSQMTGGGGMPDMSALANMMGGGGMPDMSALANMMGGMGMGGSAPPAAAPSRVKPKRK